MRSPLSRLTSPWVPSKHPVVSAVVVIVVACLAAGGGVAAGQPVDDPSDIDRLTDLVDAVARTQSDLESLDAEVGRRQEEANRTLVDVQNARDAVDSASAEAIDARSALDDSAAAIERAQAEFDTFAVRSYLDGGVGSGLTVLFDSDGPGDLLARTRLVQLITERRQHVLDDLLRTRLEAANRDSAARAARADALAAVDSAEGRRAAAIVAIDEAVAAVRDRRTRVAELTEQRDRAAAELAAARAAAAGRPESGAGSSQPPAADGDGAAPEMPTDGSVAEEQPIAGGAAPPLENDLRVNVSTPFGAVGGLPDIDAVTSVATDVLASADLLAQTIAQGSRDHTDLGEILVDPDLLIDAQPPIEAQPLIEDARPGGAASPSGTVPSHDPDSAGTGEIGDASTSSTAIETVIARALSQRGVSYSWGGGNAVGPTRGIRDGGVADTFGDFRRVGYDCSGLMVYAFAGIGISLPHYSGYQYNAGRQVPSAQMRRGDMLFWGAGGSQHVALYLGDGRMVEAPRSGDVVKVSPVRYSGMTPYAVRMVQ